MNPSGSSIKLVVSPEIPHSIIDDTFEGALIRRMVGVLRTKDGYEIWSNAGIENAAVNLDELLELARGSGSPFATVAVPMLEKAIAENEYLFLDEYGEALGIEQFDIAHVLQELCRMYPDRLTHFEIAWAEVTSSATPDFGRLGGGADFVTADAIESVNAKSWLEEMRASLRDERARTRVHHPIWERVDHRSAWRAVIPHSDWVSIAADKRHDYFEVAETKTQYRLSHSDWNEPLYFASIGEAMEEGNRLFREVTRSRDADLLASMGLSSREWHLVDEGDIAAKRSGTEMIVSWDYGDRAWLLRDGGHELGRGEAPQDLVTLIREAELSSRLDGERPCI